jgi:hypothetical protein
MERGAERVHPGVFCKKVGNSLIAKGLGKHSFLRSAEGFEKEGLNFSSFLEKSEKSEKRT